MIFPIVTVARFMFGNDADSQDPLVQRFVAWMIRVSRRRA